MLGQLYWVKTRFMNCSFSQLLSWVQMRMSEWWGGNCNTFFSGQLCLTDWGIAQHGILVTGVHPAGKLWETFEYCHVASNKKRQSFHRVTHFCRLGLVFKERTEGLSVHHLQYLLLFCCCWWSYMFIGVYIVTRVICCWLWNSREHSPHVMMYCMLNPFDIIGQECSVWLHSLTLLPWNVLSWYGKANYLF